jgi:hypothetical protein
MSDNKENVRCPKCGAATVHAEKRGWNIWVGFIGSGAIVITCLKCGHRFKPGEGLAAPVSPPPAAARQPAPPPAKKPSKLYDGVNQAGDGEIPTYKL